MSRITGSDAQKMFEAYNAVYASQEITEEQIWEEVEAWVNSLVEEGYDLSEYTWEEMYETYIEEQRGRVTGSNPNVWKPTPSTSGPSGGGMGGRRGGGSSPGGIKPTATTPATAPARPSASAPRPAAAAPVRPSAPAPRPAATPSGQGPKMSPTQALAPKPGTQAAGPASIKPKTPNPLLKGGEISGMIARSQERQTASTPKPTPMAPRQTARERMLNQSYEYDAYDLVLEYLLDNGHVDTVDEAHYVMLEMESEVIQGIVEQMTGGMTDTAADKPAAKWNKGQKLTDPRAQKIYNKLTGTKLPPA
jgi:hypothetical protein